MNAPNPALADTGAADALWSFLWGKRRSRRHSVSLGARLKGPHGETRVAAVDLSRHGTLLRVGESELAALDPVGGQPGLLAASQVLGEGFDLEFAVGVRLGARLVRLCWRQGDTDHVYLGCEFHGPLEAAALARLGLSRRLCLPETGVGTPPGTLMAYVSDPARPLELAVLDGERAPLFAGPLVGLQGTALAVHLAPADPTHVVARLSGRPHTIRVEPRGSTPWTSSAYLLAVRLLDGRTDAVEIVLASTKPPPRPLVRRMRPRAAAGRDRSTRE